MNTITDDILREIEADFGPIIPASIRRLERDVTRLADFINDKMAYLSLPAQIEATRMLEEIYGGQDED